ncbi:MAG: hypothetical protein MJ252_28355 [archaeon]|nr:hypothetical protein [archaeon]
MLTSKDTTEMGQPFSGNNIGEEIQPSCPEALDQNDIDVIIIPSEEELSNKKICIGKENKEKLNFYLCEIYNHFMGIAQQDPKEKGIMTFILKQDIEYKLGEIWMEFKWKTKGMTIIPKEVSQRIMKKLEEIKEDIKEISVLISPSLNFYSKEIDDLKEKYADKKSYPKKVESLLKEYEAYVNSQSLKVKMLNDSIQEAMKICQSSLKDETASFSFEEVDISNSNENLPETQQIQKSNSFPIISGTQDVTLLGKKRFLVTKTISKTEIKKMTKEHKLFLEKYQPNKVQNKILDEYKQNYPLPIYDFTEEEYYILRLGQTANFKDFDSFNNRIIQDGIKHIYEYIAIKEGTKCFLIPKLTKDNGNHISKKIHMTLKEFISENQEENLNAINKFEEFEKKNPKAESLASQLKDVQVGSLCKLIIMMENSMDIDESILSDYPDIEGPLLEKIKEAIGGENYLSDFINKKFEERNKDENDRIKLSLNKAYFKYDYFLRKDLKSGKKSLAKNNTSTGTLREEDD